MSTSKPAKAPANSRHVELAEKAMNFATLYSSRGWWGLNQAIVWAIEIAIAEDRASRPMQQTEVRPCDGSQSR